MDKTPAQHTYGHERWPDSDQQQIGQLLAKKLSKDTTASRVGAGNCNFQYIFVFRNNLLNNSLCKQHDLLMWKVGGLFN